ncbi:DUF4760 domain-containing protein [Bradyrhizobium sp. 30]|uniref:DUF4760 domain-containing protein n=1 Tax=Bradyrhizobium sp. 30 TaxID=2782669 RepID=UPI001FFBBD60|nr:DUF4760 domain-containing protein [Bradyrhizobium sp. 30]MCK1293050.1 DUF4760 domain-containing protein [Bradyrhizobium sp. 30]
MSGQVIASWGWAIYDTVHFAANKLLPYAPLITPCVAIVVGGIAFYSIHVTRTIARRRATIDFFLKTEADSSIVKLFQAFDYHVEAVSKQINGGKALKEVVKSDEYKTVHACLNIHELIAVGIANKVFDEKVPTITGPALSSGIVRTPARLLISVALIRMTFPPTFRCQT